jgi:hypothetical protein
MWVAQLLVHKHYSQASHPALCAFSSPTNYCCCLQVASAARQQPGIDPASVTIGDLIVTWTIAEGLELGVFVANPLGPDGRIVAELQLIPQPPPAMTFTEQAATCTPKGSVRTVGPFSSNEFGERGDVSGGIAQVMANKGWSDVVQDVVRFHSKHS